MSETVKLSVHVDGPPREATLLSRILFPAKDAALEFIVTAQDDNGQPVSGVTVRGRATPRTLTAPRWRDIEQLTARWPSASGATIKARYRQGLVRLGATFRSGQVETDSRGQAKFDVRGWHVCGGGSSAATDELRFIIANGRDAVARVRCGVEGLVRITSDKALGLVTKAGIQGAYVQEDLDTVLRRAARDWKAASTDMFGQAMQIVVTDASLRWGGLHSPHLTHRFGGAVDIRAVSTDGRPTKIGSSNYSRQGTARLIKIINRLGATRVVFGEALEGVAEVRRDHNRHLHASWLPSPKEPW